MTRYSLGAIIEVIAFPSDPTVGSSLAMPGASSWYADIRKRVTPTKRRIAIMSALATGWLPWGVQWDAYLPLVWSLSDKGRPTKPEFILCCGHVMRPKEAQLFVDNGLLKLGEPQGGRDTLVITPAGRTWLQFAW